MSYLKKTRLIMGKRALQELLRVDPRRIIKVYTDKEQDPLVAELEGQGFLIRRVSKKELFSLVNSESHQGFVIEVKEKHAVDLPTFLEEMDLKEKAFVLMLDSLSDPQNLGSILRASECFGIEGVVWSKNRSVDLTPSVSKASAGASELVNTLKVSNLAETASAFQKRGFCLIVADMSTEAKPLYSFRFPSKVLLVAGSEGHGVQQLIKKRADLSLFIPMHGEIGSLNVSQAVAVFLSHYRSQV